MIEGFVKTPFWWQEKWSLMVDCIPPIKTCVLVECSLCHVPCSCKLHHDAYVDHTWTGARRLLLFTPSNSWYALLRDTVWIPSWTDLFSLLFQSYTYAVMTRILNLDHTITYFLDKCENHGHCRWQCQPLFCQQIQLNDFVRMIV